MFRGGHIAAALLAAALLLSIAGCGGGSSASSSSDGGSTDSSAKTTSSGGGSKYDSFGEESSAEEREAASKVLAENLRAREAGDWAVQCSSLSPGAIKRLEEPARIRYKKGGCVRGLKLLAEPLKSTKAVRVDTLSGSIYALRVKGDRALALYHGNDGKDYAMPMKKVAGQWKVDALLTTEAS